MGVNRIIQVTIFLFATATLLFTLPASVISQETEESIEHEAGFYYTIHKGDTLWDLSDSFFDTPWYWPELWKENDQIPNPHRIYPGERIRLFQKKGTDTFTLKRPEQESMTQESATATSLGDEGLETAEEESLYYLYPAIDAIGFIRKEPVNPLGYIFKVIGDKILINEGDTVYISYADTEGSGIMQGSRYPVYRKLEPTRDRHVNKKLGAQYYVLGMIEVVKMESDFCIAKVVKSYRAIELDDFILPYMKRSPKIPVVDSTSDLVGKIIVSEDHLDLIGDWTVAFIDKGTNDNVTPGQIYSLFYQETKKMEGQKEKALTLVDFGKLIVLHTEKSTSTVLITQTIMNASPGSLVRTPID